MGMDATHITTLQVTISYSCDEKVDLVDAVAEAVQDMGMDLEVNDQPVVLDEVSVELVD